jgi:hypothetical protein
MDVMIEFRKTVAGSKKLRHAAEMLNKEKCASLIRAEGKRADITVFLPKEGTFSAIGSVICRTNRQRGVNGLIGIVASTRENERAEFLRFLITESKADLRQWSFRDQWGGGKCAVDLLLSLASGRSYGILEHGGVGKPFLFGFARLLIIKVSLLLRFIRGIHGNVADSF